MLKRLTPNQACELARSLEGVTEKDHFGSDAFIANGRIFATVWHDKNVVNLMLSREGQKPFLARDGGEAFRTLENSWGDHAFSAQLGEIDPELFREALHAAWASSGQKRARLGGAKAEKKAKTAKKKPGKKRKSPKKSR